MPILVRLLWNMVLGLWKKTGNKTVYKFLLLRAEGDNLW